MQDFKELLLESKLVKESDLGRGFFYIPDFLCQELSNLWRWDNVKKILIPMMWIGNLARHINYWEVEGYEVYGENLKIASKVSDAKIINEDFLNADISKTYDLIVWTIPFGMRFKWDAVKETKEWFKLRKSEEAYIYKSLNLLNQDWKLILVVPNGFLFNRTLQDFRVYLTKNYNLNAIIEFEWWRKWAFYPHTWINTSLIIITNNASTWLVYMDKYDWWNIAEKLSSRQMYNQIDIKNLTETRSVSYHLFDNSIIDNELVDYDVTTIWEVAEIFTWRPPSADKIMYDWWEYAMIMPKNIQWEIVVPVQWQKYANSFKWMRVIEEWDILISNFWPDFRTVIVKEENPKYLAHPNIIVIRDKTKYLKLFYDSNLWDKIFNSYLRKYSAWSIVKRISISDIKSFKIPKLEVSYNEIVSDSEQVMIDQLKQSAENKWRTVNVEYKLSDTKIADLALEYQWKIEAIIEVKRNIKDKRMLIHQVEDLLNWTDIKDAFILDQNSFYHFDIEKKWLVEMKGFPDPKEWLSWNSNNKYEINWYHKTWEAKSEQSWASIGFGTRNTDQVEYLNAESGRYIINYLEKKYDSKLDMLLKIAARVDVNVIENIAITKSVQSNVQEIKSMISESLDKIDSIKNKEFDLEWKLILIQEQVQKIWDDLKKSNEDWYLQHETLLKSRILNRDDLHDLSKEYLPVWSLLFEELSKFEWIDFSPVVLEYCRSLENELLNKIFVAFSAYMNENFDDVNELVSWEDESKLNWEEVKSYMFSRMVKKFHKKPLEEVKYTLGNIIFILDLIKKDSWSTLQQSRLLQEFHKFLRNKFWNWFGFLVDYLKTIGEINKKFRIRCAHTEKLTKDEAKECQNTLPNSIDEFLDHI